MEDVSQLNFHHLRYFWAVAHEGNLSRVARRLHVAQSALSAQIQALEAALATPLFHRRGRTLVLTEAGTLTLAHADAIFAAGGELIATLARGRRREEPLRVGAVATLSRNFQESFLSPLLGRDGVRLRLESASLDALLPRLSAQELDLVLANRPAPRAPGSPLRSQRLARQRVSLVAARPRRGFRFPAGLRGEALVVPGPASAIRDEFDALCEQHGVRPTFLAEVDDMAMLRLMARDSGAISLVPSVVVRDELASGALHELCELPEVLEAFYAITAERRFRHPLVRELLARGEDALLAPGA